MSYVFPEDMVAGDEIAAADFNKLRDSSGWASILFGENIDGSSSPQVLYLKGSDSKLYLADASFFDERSQAIGLTVSNKSTDEEGYLQTQGLITIPSQTLETAISSTKDQYYSDENQNSSLYTLSNTSAQVSQGFMVGDQVGNIEKIKIYMGSSNATVKLELYAIDSDAKPTGSALATSDTVTISSTTLFTFTFATPYEVSPGDRLCFVITPVTVTSNLILRGFVSNNGPKLYNFVKEGSITGYANPCNYSNDTGSSFSALSTTVNFETYTTLRKIQYGDPIFLSETAGEFSLTRPIGTGACIKKIGELISLTKMLIKGREEIFLGKASASAGASDYELYPTIAVPPKTEKIILYGKGESTLVVGVLTRNFLSIRIDLYSAGTTNCTVTWDGNIVRVIGSSAGGDFTPALTVAFYT